MCPKIRVKFELSSVPYNAEGEWKCVPYYRKGDEINSHFDA